MRVCCVQGCKASKKQGLELKYFKFPKSRPVRQAWQRAVKRSLKQSGASLICSAHFLDSDFTTGGGRFTLKKTAVPSVDIDRGDPKPNHTRKRTTSNKEEDSAESEGSTSDKEDNKSVTNDTESGVNNKAVIATNCRLDSVNTDGSCGNSETIIGDVPVKEVFSGTVGNDSVLDSVDKCTNDDKSADKVAVDGCGKASELEACLLRSTESHPNTNGCDLPPDPLSCPNGEPGLLSPPKPPKTSPTDPEKPPPETEKPLDPDKPLADTTDIEILLDNENPPAIIANPLEKNVGVEMTVLDPKTGLMRSGSVESIQDSCESLDESTEERLKLAEPVFVEISVDPAGIGTPSPPDSPNDCMMIVENVQVDIDPNLLLMMGPGDEEGRPPPDDDDDDDVQVLEKKPEEPVSLLTSSDEDDVIFEEPEIDCVSVSDETDEDDQPLTRLLKISRKQAQARRVTDILHKRLKDIFWGKCNEFYCYLCKFVTKSKADLVQHAQLHAAGAKPPALSFNVCNVCSFQTPSLSQFSRHKRKHKEEKKFQCKMCEYKARHKMSLVYHVRAMHLKEVNVDVEELDLDKVTTPRRSKVTAKKRLESRKRSPETKKRSPESKKRSPETKKRSPETKKRSPETKKRSPETKRSRRSRKDDDYSPGTAV